MASTVTLPERKWGHLMDCNGIAVQFIDSYSHQINLLATWAIPVLGLTLSALTAIRFRAPFLPTPRRPDRYPRVSPYPLVVATVLLFVSLVLSYFATNALTQAIPDICRHSFAKDSLATASTLYGFSLWLMRAQYLAFGAAMLCAAGSVLFDAIQWNVTIRQR